jgi:hypothetical protein
MNWAVFSEPLHGKERLAVVFWYYNVVVFVAAVLLAVLIVTIPQLLGAGGSNFFEWVGFGFFVSYLFWATISLWQCAFNTKRKIFGYLARAYVIYTVCVSTYGAIEAFS